MSVARSCLTLCDPMDCSPLGSSILGILQARMLEWVAIPFFRGPSRLRDQTWVSCITDRFFTIWATGKLSIYLVGEKFNFNKYFGPLPLLVWQKNLRNVWSVEGERVQVLVALASITVPRTTQYLPTLGICSPLGSQRVKQNLATEQQQANVINRYCFCC